MNWKSRFPLSWLNPRTVMLEIPASKDWHICSSSSYCDSRSAFRPTLSRSCPGAGSNSVVPISLTMQLRNFCSRTNITSMISPNKFCIYIIIWGGTLISFSLVGIIILWSLLDIGKRQGERPEEMGLLTIIKKVKKKEKEMRILMVYEFWP